MTERVQRGGLRSAKVLDDLVAERMLPDTGIELDAFWNGFESIVDDLTPKNRALLATRDALQEKIDAWHLARRGQTHDADAYKAFSQKSATSFRRVATSRSKPPTSTPKSLRWRDRNSWSR